MRLHYLPAHNRCDPSSTDRPNLLILLDVLLGQHTTFSREIPILCQHLSDFEPVSAVASLGPGSRDTRVAVSEAVAVRGIPTVGAMGDRIHSPPRRPVVSHGWQPKVDAKYT